MAWDEALLESSGRLGAPVLRFYSWSEPAATFGYSQHISQVAGWTPLRPLIRRPTGGGLVPHDADWTYSIVFPPSHPWSRIKAAESYRRLHEWLQHSFALVDLKTQLAPEPRKVSPGQCFAGAEKFDLLQNGAKIAGAAQRRNRLGFLIQGSVQPQDRKCARSEWEHAMLDVAFVEYRYRWIPLIPDQKLTARAEQLAAEKYSQVSHNELR